ncbi:MAG: ABC transporter ATP-binding protein [Clostridia bacterium]|nr:ABC transporter ATP-binding protein [Clostridia bacterium]
MENEVFLSVKNLTVDYETHDETVYAVRDVSFELKKGATLGLVGETGAGKTSIARAILRVLPEPPAKLKSGEIYLNGQELNALSEKEMYQIRGKKITMIFQDPMTALNPVMRVGDQIAEVVLLHDHVSKEEARKRAIGMLEQVGISADRYDDYPNQFSGGMKQRVVIAIALACSPDLLLADEPTTALDVTIQAQVLRLIKKLVTTQHTSMLLITHDLGVVAQTCDEVAIVYAGQIVEKGNKEDIFDRHAHPYTIGLLGAIPTLDSKVKRLATIKGLPPDPTVLPKGCSFCERCPFAEADCASVPPALQEIAPGHLCRCHHPQKGGNGK